MRQATEFKQESWETLGGAAAAIKLTERAQSNRSTTPYHTGISKESSQRGRDNAMSLRRNRNK